MHRFRLIEHTADIGIEACADSREELFVEAACGLKDVLLGTANIPREKEVSVDVEGADDGELLVNWLNEIIFLFETRHFLPTNFSIDHLEADRLNARVAGATFDAASHSVEREVKAATYHQLRVEQRNGTWFARIYLDL